MDSQAIIHVVVGNCPERVWRCALLGRQYLPHEDLQGIDGGIRGGGVRARGARARRRQGVLVRVLFRGCQARQLIGRHRPNPLRVGRLVVTLLRAFVDDAEARRHLELRGDRLPLGVEEMERVGAADRQAVRGCDVVQVDAARDAAVHAAEVDGELSIDEDPEDV